MQELFKVACSGAQRLAGEIAGGSEALSGLMKIQEFRVVEGCATTTLSKIPTGTSFKEASP